VDQRVELGERQPAVSREDRQARGAEPSSPQVDRVVAGGREWRLARPGRLAAIEAVDVPQQVVGALHLVEDPAPLEGPVDRVLIVRL
jgi:hypothetical protein